MEIHADRDICIGGGMCVMTAPELFDQDDDEGKVVLLAPSSPVPESLQEKARLAVHTCPSGAISLTSD